MRYHPQYTCLLCLLLIADVAHCQEVRYRFKQISVDQGLSQNSVYAIEQDRKGFMWFGTKDGLNRYDGYSFTVFRNDPEDPASLADNFITVLLVDKGGRMWVGTKNGGLHVFDNKNETFIRIPFFLQSGVGSPASQIDAIVEDDSGNVWVGTNGFGLAKVSVREQNKYSVSSFRNNPGDRSSLANDWITALHFDDKGVLWVGTIGYLQSVSAHDARPRFTHHAVPSRTGGEGTRAYSLITDSRKRMWLGSNYGIYRYDQEKDTFIPHVSFEPNEGLVSNVIRTMREDLTGIIWVGTFSRIFLFEPDEGRYREVQTTGIRYNGPVISIFSDTNGTLWFGSNGGGVYAYDPGIIQFQSYTSESINVDGSLSVRSLFQDTSGHLWVGAYGGVYVGNARRTSFRRIARISEGEPPRRIIQDREGTLWFAVPKGVVRTTLRGEILRWYLRDSSNHTFSIPHDRYVTAVFEDRRGNIWIITLSSLSMLDKRRGWIRRQFRTLQKAFNDDVPAAVHEDTAGGIWFTSEDGLWKYDRTTEQFSQYTNTAGKGKQLNYNVTLSLCPDPREPNRYLWIGTAGGGLNRLEYATGNIHYVTKADGLPNNVVYGILSDSSGLLWLSTNHGIARYDPVTGGVRTFASEDGLQSNEYNAGAYCKDRNGEMFFGGIYGFDSFNPNQWEENASVPPVVITELQLFNRPVTIGDETNILEYSVPETKSITLSYDQNIVTIQFASLDFAFPAKNRYRYKLEGFNNSFIESGTNRTATFTNLDPGSYIFRAQGTNSDGIWSDKVAELSVNILPPYWMTWWFRTILALLFFSIGPFLYWRRVSALKREQVRRNVFTGKLIENQEHERKRIAAELHDSLGQTLLIIKNRALSGLKVSRVNTKQKKQLDAISASASEAINEVRDMAYRLRPYQLDSIGITKAIKGMAEKAFAASDIAFTVSIDTLEGSVPRDEEINVYRIVQESVSNIIRHSRATAASVRITRENGACSIVIQDNGVGMRPDNETATGSVRRGFGLTGIAERVRMLGGEVSIQSVRGRGTTLSINIAERGTMK